MYGSETTDLVVKYYDEAFGISGEAELAWYLGKARAFGGPVLDLACGTGGLALLLAREGFEVTALDRSPGMLSLLRDKLRAEPPATARRVRIENGEMSNFTLDARLGTVVCCDAFFHNMSSERQIGCLQSVARHLLPGGRFVFNLPNPTCDFILKSATCAGTDFVERGRYSLSDGSGTVLVEEAHAGVPLDQTITTRLRITRYDTDGKEVERGESTWTTRYLFRCEAVHLLYRCGFEVEELVGNYANGPITDGGQLIFQARLKDTASF